MKISALIEPIEAPRRIGFIVTAARAHFHKDKTVESLRNSEAIPTFTYKCM